MGAPTNGPSVYRTPAHHLWASPGYPAKERPALLEIGFDVDRLDLVSPLSEEVSEVISQHELPHLCDSRPHEDPYVEVWLSRWADGEGLEGGEPLELSALALSGLIALTEERPEVCPLLRSHLGRFEALLASWFKEWPRTEPWRGGLPKNAVRHHGPTAEEAELELHAALAVVRSGVLPAASQALRESAEHFRLVALGWILKLDSLYGLSMVEQPDRLGQIASVDDECRLSLLQWEASEISELLGTQFFRPQETDLLRFTQRWLSEAPGGGEVADNAFDEILIQELLAFTGSNSPRAGPTSFGDACVISGSTFRLVSRQQTCPLAEYNDQAAFFMELGAATPTSLRCWNAAKESQLLGASRQLVVSKSAMSSAGGKYRLDFRVNADTDVEAAHLFEVGIIADPEGGVRFRTNGPGVDSTDEVSHAFSFVSVLDTLVEGVRMTAEVDFDEGTVMIRNLPRVEGFASDLPTPLAP